jgi:hypothetical protein
VTRSFLAGLLTLAVVLVAGSATVISAATAKPLIRTQVPCVGPQGYCRQIVPSGTFPFTLRQWQFSIPGPGDVSFTLTGDLLCSSDDTANSAVIDLVSQIVTTANAVPSLSGAGALRLGGRLVPKNPAAYSTTWSLASTRVVHYTSGGTKTVFLRIDSLRMDPDTSCLAYDSGFSLVYVP